MTVPNSNGTTSHKNCQTCSKACSAKNLYVWTLRNFNHGTYNVRTLANENYIEVLITKLPSVKWNIIDLSKVKRTGEKSLELYNCHILYY